MQRLIEQVYETIRKVEVAEWRKWANRCESEGRIMQAGLIRDAMALAELDPSIIDTLHEMQIFPPKEGPEYVQ